MFPFLIPCREVLRLLLFFAFFQLVYTAHSSSTEAVIVCGDEIDVCTPPTCTTEADALMDFYNVMGGASWINNTGWGVGDPCVNTWYGVACWGGMTVKSISLPDNNLIGTIPAELACLTDLAQINLSNDYQLIAPNNDLTGSLPPDFFTMTNFNIINLRHNENLGGLMSPDFSNLTNLVYLFLNNCGLTGTIPSSLGTMPSLRRLFLNNNNFTGSIPPELGNISTLDYLFLSHNQLTGTLPPELCNLALIPTIVDAPPNGYGYINLNNNNLSGCYPDCYSMFCGLPIWHVNFSGNPLLPGGGSIAFFENTFCAQGNDLNIAAYTLEICSDDGVDYNLDGEQVNFGPLFSGHTIEWYQGEPISGGVLISPTSNADISNIATGDLWVNLIDPADNCEYEFTFDFINNTSPTIIDPLIDVCFLDSDPYDLTQHDAFVNDNLGNTVRWFNGDPNISGSLIFPATAIDLKSITELWVEVENTLCTSSLMLSLNIGSELMLNCSVVSHESCSGENDGSAIVSVTGGTGVYTYIWSSGGMADTESSLAEGMYSVVVTDGNNCSDQCNVTIDPGINISMIQNIQSICNDNGTPSDPSDDWFTIAVNATSSNSGASNTYELVLNADSDGNNGTVLDDGIYDIAITYGTTIPHQFLADGSSVYILTLRDKDSPSCHVDFTTTPVASCSDLCAITAIATTPICNDGGTPSDSSDDTYTFDVTVSGSNTATNWTATDPNGTTAAYGTTTFGPYPAGGSDFNFTITDDIDPACSENIVIVDPGSCSPVCLITVIPTTPICNDAGTPSDPSDDTFTFDVAIAGFNVGAGWSANDPNNMTGTYSTTVTFGPYLISGGNLSIDITDDLSSTCTTNINITAPSTCSDMCSISAIVANVTCNNNGTASDDSDDTFTFSVTVTGNNIAPTWIANDGNTTTGSYNSATVFGPYDISGGDLMITITDAIDNGCTTIISVSAPNTCSSTCSIYNSISNVICNDNGTPSDPNDDVFTFDVTVIGSNISGGWSADDINNEIGFYGVATGFGPFSISNGVVNFTITDDIDIACTTIVNVPPPPTCSDQCEIIATTTTPVCNDNGTPSDPSDDTFTFDVTVSGNNTSAGWTAIDPNTTTGSYDIAVNFGPYPINGGDLNFIISDGNDAGCFANVMVVAPATCSDVCAITTTSTTPVCNDGGTPTDPSDDTYTFDMTITGDNTGTAWTATDPNGTTGNYGTVTFGPYLAGGIDLNFIISDDLDGACNESIIVVDPGTCSPICAINAIATTPICNDAGTPSDPSDDTFTFDVTVSGSNIGSGWNASDPNGMNGNYMATITFGPYLISGGDLSFTITDDIDAGCTTNVNVIAPTTCSDQCNVDATYTNVMCNHNGTVSDDTDDTFTFSVTVTGNNTATSWIADDGNSTTGNYNSATVFGPYDISGGDLTITITDASDSGCNTIINVTAPNTCSSTCSISNSVSGILCNDNGTPSDASDDTFTFDVTVTGSNISGGWSANDINNETGFYGISANFGPFAIADGIINFTITDDVDGVCVTNVMVSPPSTCSDQCAINAIATAPICNDNGTPSDPSDDTFVFDVTVSGSNTG
ncbi:MAG: hypothetical protein V3V14_14545, partial [Saprospiraceae bacterium]